MAKENSNYNFFLLTIFSVKFVKNFSFVLKTHVECAQSFNIGTTSGRISWDFRIYCRIQSLSTHLSLCKARHMLSLNYVTQYDGCLPSIGQ